MTKRKQHVRLEGRKYVRDVDVTEDGTGRVLIKGRVLVAVLNYPTKEYWQAIARSNK